MTTLVLASRSPRRADILRRMGVRFEVESPDVDETPLPNESPREHVRRLALAKCRRVADRHPGSVVVLAADTTVDLDGEILGTPADVDQARAMLRRLSGRTHLVHTAICVSRGAAADGRQKSPGEPTPTVALDTAAVTMCPIDPDLLERYLATGESLDKAGAYAVQGEAAIFVERVTGQITTVVGLPVRLVERVLGPLGLLPAEPRP